jgi:2-hydroxycyclohexanecarboxyl-CoA dehydrogenase
MRGLSQKHVLVTGGGSGIGAAICKRLGEEGCMVSIFDQNHDAAKRIADEIKTNGGTASAYRVDITNRDQVKIGIELAEAEQGSIFGLVNNAGWDRAIPFLESGPEHWDKVIDINLKGPINVTHAVVSRMAERGSGRVVSIASDAGRVGSSGESVYSACKGGMIALTKTLARELARSGITLNCLCPGPTETPLLDNLDPDGRLVEALKKAIPLRRLGQPEDYPGLVCFMLSDDAAYMTGQTISVSGGLTMHG